MSAGKGDKLRAGANLQSYWENYDNIFRKRKTIKQWQKHFNDVIIDYDGFREYNADDLITEQQYKKQLELCTLQLPTNFSKE
jgi:hypothetical protein